MMGIMELNNLPTLLREWKEDALRETDEPLVLLEEMKRIENRHRQILQLSGDLEDAYNQLLQKIK
jgi:hypothetical protein